MALDGPFREAENLQRQRWHGGLREKRLLIAFAGRSNGFALLESMKSVFEQPNGQRSAVAPRPQSPMHNDLLTAEERPTTERCRHDTGRIRSDNDGSLLPGV